MAAGTQMELGSTQGASRSRFRDAFFQVRGNTYHVYDETVSGMWSANTYRPLSGCFPGLDGSFVALTDLDAHPGTSRW